MNKKAKELIERFFLYNYLMFYYVTSVSME